MSGWNLDGDDNDIYNWNWLEDVPWAEFGEDGGNIAPAPENDEANMRTVGDATINKDEARLWTVGDAATKHYSSFSTPADIGPVSPSSGGSKAGQNAEVKEEICRETKKTRVPTVFEVYRPPLPSIQAHDVPYLGDTCALNEASCSKLAQTVFHTQNSAEALDQGIPNPSSRVISDDIGLLRDDPVHLFEDQSTSSASCQLKNAVHAPRSVAMLRCEHNFGQGGSVLDNSWGNALILDDVDQILQSGDTVSGHIAHSYADALAWTNFPNEQSNPAGLDRNLAKPCIPFIMKQRTETTLQHGKTNFCPRKDILGTDEEEHAMAVSGPGTWKGDTLTIWQGDEKLNQAQSYGAHCQAERHISYKKMHSGSSIADMQGGVCTVQNSSYLMMSETSKASASQGSLMLNLSSSQTDLRENNFKNYFCSQISPCHTSPLLRAIPLVGSLPGPQPEQMLRGYPGFSLKYSFEQEHELQEMAVEVPPIGTATITSQAWIGANSSNTNSAAQEVNAVDWRPISGQDEAPVEEKSSLESTVLEQLERTMLQLDIQTRLSIRDALYRLARNAVHRHVTIWAQSSHENSKDMEIGASGSESSRSDPSNLSRPSRFAGLDAMETETNSIDRSIANLLFHKESPTLPAGHVYVQCPYEITKFRMTPQFISGSESSWQRQMPALNVRAACPQPSAAALIPTSYVKGAHHSLNSNQISENANVYFEHEVSKSSFPKTKVRSPDWISTTRYGISPNISSLSKAGDKVETFTPLLHQAGCMCSQFGNQTLPGAQDIYFGGENKDLEDYVIDLGKRTQSDNMMVNVGEQAGFTEIPFGPVAAGFNQRIYTDPKDAFPFFRSQGVYAAIGSENLLGIPQEIGDLSRDDDLLRELL